MKLDEYQLEARSTAIYPGKLTYPALGLCGEVGELIVACRQGDKENIQKEIGDCLWYVANVAYDAGLTLSEVCCRNMFTYGRHDIFFWNVEEACTGLTIRVGNVAENVKKTLRDNAGDLQPDRRASIKLTLAMIVKILNYIAVNSGTTLNKCAEANLDKLRSRKERGKLTGDGDNR